jgi:hypothetical protein
MTLHACFRPFGQLQAGVAHTRQRPLIPADTQVSCMPDLVGRVGEYAFCRRPATVPSVGATAASGVNHLCDFGSRLRRGPVLSRGRHRWGPSRRPHPSPQPTDHSACLRHAAAAPQGAARIPARAACRRERMSVLQHQLADLVALGELGQRIGVGVEGEHLVHDHPETPGYAIGHLDELEV